MEGDACGGGGDEEWRGAVRSRRTLERRGLGLGLGFRRGAGIFGGDEDLRREEAMRMAASAIGS